MMLSLSLPRSAKVSKILASFLSITLFSFNGVVSPQAYSFSERSADPRFSLPSAFGKIEVDHSQNLKHSSKSLVILIQDAHGSAEAQKTIQNILSYSREKFGVTQIAIEGAEGKADTLLLQTFPDHKSLEKVIQHYVDQGELSGASAYAILSQQKTNLIGLENSKLYDQGLAYYLAGLEIQKMQLEKFIKIEQALEALKSKKFSPALLGLDHAVQGFEKNVQSLNLLLEFVSEQMSKASTQKYPHLNLVLQEFLKSEAESDFRSEIKALETLIKKNSKHHSAKKTFQQLVQSHQTEQISDRAFAVSLMKLVHTLDLAFPVSLKLKRALEQDERLHDLKTQTFYQELRAWISESKKNLIKTREEDVLNQLTEESVLLNKLIRFELSREDWEALKKLRIESDFEGLQNQLDELKTTAVPQMRFYQTAEAREEVMFANLQKFRDTGKGIRDTSTSYPLSLTPMIVVAGGFHSQGLMCRFEKNQIPFVLVTPAMTHASDEFRYSDLMRGEVSWNQNPAQKNTSDFYLQFLRAASGSLTRASHNNLQTSSNLWQTEILETLDQENRLEEASNYLTTLEKIQMTPGSENENASKLSKIQNLIDRLTRLRLDRKPSQDVVFQTISQFTMTPRVLNPVFPSLEMTSAGRNEVRNQDLHTKALELEEINRREAELVKRRQELIPIVRGAIERLADNLMSELPKHWQLVDEIVKALGPDIVNQDIQAIPPLALIRLLDEKKAWEKVVASNDVIEKLDALEEEFDTYLENQNTYVARQAPDLLGSNTAYFSAEYGFQLPRTVAGGLGILSGDHVRGASDLGLSRSSDLTQPGFVAIGLRYLQGYFRQRIDPAGRQNVDHQYSGVDLRDIPLKAVKVPGSDVDLVIEIPLPHRPHSVKAKVWRLTYGKVNLLLLDTDLPENQESDRAITRSIYREDNGSWGRMEQYFVLGVGGIKILEALGRTPDVLHLNDGHPMFAALESLAQTMKNLPAEYTDPQQRFEMALEQVRAKTVFTTHTPVAAGNESVDPDHVLKPFLQALFSNEYAVNRVLSLGMQDGKFSITTFCLRVSNHHNGVSRIHGAVSRDMWKPLYPGVHVDQVPITGIVNAVHGRFWRPVTIEDLLLQALAASPELAGDFNYDPKGTDADLAAWEAFKAHWSDDAWLDQHSGINNEDLRRVKKELKQRLLEEARRRLQIRISRGDAGDGDRDILQGFSDDALTIGFARRFITYKRALLIFYNLERLKNVARKARKPIQIFFAGKAHPRDGSAQEILKEVNRVARELNADPSSNIKVHFIEEYDIELARVLEPGVDIWLNNPIRPLEASGTSGMKVGAAASLNLSIRDGWTPEGLVDGKNGFFFGEASPVTDDADDAEALYQKLEEVIHIWDHDPEKWARMMKASLFSISYYFEMKRMLAEYAQKLYLPAFRNGRDINPERAKEAATQRLATRQKIQQAFQSGEGPVVEKITYPLQAARGENFLITADIDFKSLSPEEMGVDIVIGKYHTPWNWYGMNGHVQALSDNKYRITFEVALDQLGESGFRIRIAPRDQISWEKASDLQAVTIFQDTNKSITVQDAELFRRRAANPISEGLLFYLQIPPHFRVSQVFWVSEKTGWVSNGHNHLTRLPEDANLWSLVIASTETGTDPNFHFKFLVIFDDGRQEWWTGNYATNSHFGNAVTDVDPRSPLFSPANAQNALDKLNVVESWTPAPRSELRQIAGTAIKELWAHGKIERTASDLARAVNHDFNGAVASLRQQAAQLLEPSADVQNAISGYRAAQGQLADFSSPAMLGAFFNQVESYLNADPSHELHFAWAMPVSEDANIQAWLAGFLAKLDALKVKRGLSAKQLSVHLALLAAPDQVGAANLFKQQFSNSVDVIEIENSETARNLNRFLNQNPTALFYGAESLSASVPKADRFRRIDFQNVVFSEVFPVLTLLHFFTAQETAGLTAEKLSKIPEQFLPINNGMIFQGRLIVTERTREWGLKIQTARLIASMA